MAGESHQHEQILAEARRSLADQRAGGRRRAAPIGRGSAELRRKNLMTRIKLIAGSAVAIVVAAMVAGLIIDGIGFIGVMVTAMAIMCAIAAFSNYPKVKVPRRADLNTGDVRHMVARTELWLEHQRPALPPPAVTLVDKIGTQLDALGLQLETVDPAHPAAQETRKLVGEHLPEMVDAYRRIPAHLRKERRAGATPDDQLVESLGKISAEIDTVTRQLADGALDDLAIRTRYLDYRYGEAEEHAPEKN
jgi:Mg2+/Co2+ transporter CorB